MQTERLIGGLCDGLEVSKTSNLIVYAGMKSDGWINVYTRREDGLLHFSFKSHVKDCAPGCVAPPGCSVKFTSSGNTVEVRCGAEL